MRYVRYVFRSLHVREKIFIHIINFMYIKIGKNLRNLRSVSVNTDYIGAERVRTFVANLRKTSAKNKRVRALQCRLYRG